MGRKSKLWINMNAKKIKMSGDFEVLKDKSVQYYLDIEKKYKALKKEKKCDDDYTLSLEEYVESLEEHRDALQDLVKSTEKVIEILER